MLTESLLLGCSAAILGIGLAYLFVQALLKLNPGNIPHMESHRRLGQAAGRRNIGGHRRIFDALGDPTRRAIVDRLRPGPLSVSSLADPLQISLTAVGQHLQLLEETGLVHTKKLGRVRTCRL
jgi:predicted Rossmann fold nucleotide-binding protein DprA/Smf involved in DNA uptake